MPATIRQTNQLRRELLSFARRSDRYPFISTVEDYLAQVPDDHQIRSLAVKELAEKGLWTVAVELGRACPSDDPEARQLREVTEQLVALPSEVVAWATTDTQFKANLEVLRLRGRADVAELLERAGRDVAENFTLHQANDGNVQVRGTRSDGVPIWIPAALDFTNQIEVTGDGKAFTGKLVSPFLFEGVGMGWWLSRLHDITQRTFLSYGCAIYIVETNLRALALVLRLHDWTVPLADERVYLFAGSRAWDEWADMMKSTPQVFLPKTVQRTMRWPGQQPDLSQARLDEVVRYRDESVAELRPCVERIYSGRDVAYWAERYAKADASDPLRVLCITSRYTTFLQYSMRDTVAALEQAGYRAHLLIEEKDHYQNSGQSVLEAFEAFRPDLVMIIDHHRYEQPTYYIEHVPFACWVQDPLHNLMNEKAGRSLGPLDFSFGYYKPKCTKQFGYPPERFFYCPIPVSARTFHTGKVEPSRAESYGSDVIYVGNMPDSITNMREEFRACQTDALRSLLDAIDERIDGIVARAEHFSQHCPLPNPGRLVAGIAKELKLTLPAGLIQQIGSFYAYRRFDVGFRMQTLEWVARWAERTGRKFHLYGRGWPSKQRFAPYARGPIENGEPLRCAYRCSRLAIQTIPGGFRHQRTFEALACGCLVLGRYVPGDFDGLTPEQTRAKRLAGESLRGNAGIFPGLDRVVFRDADEFAALADAYLENADHYRETSEALRECVLERFSYQTVIPGIVKQIGDSLKQQAAAVQTESD